MAKEKELDFSMFDDAVVEESGKSGDTLDLSMFDDDDAPIASEGINADYETPEEISKLESGLRGALQGLTFDFGDEIIGAGEAAGKAAFGDDVISREELLKNYKKYRDESRANMKAAEEENPATYLASDIGAGIVPAIFTGGAGAAISAGKIGGKQALKQLAKTGAKYGAAVGAGTSEAEILEGDVGGLAKDVAIGSALGAGTSVAMPYLGKAVGKTLSGTGKAIKGAVKAIPGAEDIGTAFKYGLKGRELTAEHADEDLMGLAKDLYSRIGKTKNRIDLKSAKKELEAFGIKVDTEKQINAAVKDLEKMAKGDIFEGKSSKVLDGLKRLRGDDLEADKAVQSLEKKDLSKRLKDLGLEDEAQASTEKSAAEAFARSGKEEANFQKMAGEVGEEVGIERPVDIAGVFDEELGTFVKGTRPYSPGQISKGVDPKTGLPFAIQQDMASGKVTAQIGKLTDKVERDVADMSLSEVDDVIAQINSLTKVATNEGYSADPAIKRAMRLAGELRDKVNKTIENSGVDPKLIDKRAKMSDLLSAEDLMGISKRKSAVNKVNQELQEIEIGNKMGFDRGFKDRQEMDLTERLLGDTLSEGGLKEDMGFMRDVNRLIGRESMNETITRSSLYTQLIGKVPNLIGRKAKSAGDTTLAKFSKNIMGMTKDKYDSFVKMITSSADDNMKEFLGPLTKAMESPHKKDVILWSLSQQPGFKQAVRSFLGEEEDMYEESETIAEEPLQEPLEDVTREPQSMLTEENADSLKVALAKRESGGDSKVINSLGYVGKYQFGAAALEDLGYLKPGSYKKSKNSASKDPANYTGKDGVNSLEDFLNSEEMQDKAMDQFLKLNYERLKKKGIDVDNLSQKEVAGMLASTHLLGAGGTKKLLDGMDSEDAYGTKGSEYLKLGEDSVKDEKYYEELLEESSKGKKKIGE